MPRIGKESDIHAERLYELVSEKPDFTIDWAYPILASIFVPIFALFWMVSYPDVVVCDARLTSINSPKEVITKTEGKLDRILVKENEIVERGTMIALIESLDKYEGIETIAKKLTCLADSLDFASFENLSAWSNSTQPHLGELQLNYQVFIQGLLAFQAYLPGGYHMKRLELLSADLHYLELSAETLNNQRELMKEDVLLAEETFEANGLLKQQSVISTFDYRLEQSKLISKRLAMHEIESSLLLNEAQQNEKRKEMMALQNEAIEHGLTFKQNLKTIISQIEEWKQKHILRAPVDGTVSYASFLQENQWIKSGQVLCYINPPNTTYFAEITVPQQNFGKIIEGQRVILKFQSYPHEEYGIVDGTISDIASSPNEKGYRAKVRLPNGLVTNHGKKIQFRDGLTAVAEIVTNDVKLFDRVYFEITKKLTTSRKNSRETKK